jgi:hypothetical protein
MLKTAIFKNLEFNVTTFMDYFTMLGHKWMGQIQKNPNHGITKIKSTLCMDVA